MAGSFVSPVMLDMTERKIITAPMTRTADKTNKTFVVRDMVVTVAPEVPAPDRPEP